MNTTFRPTHRITRDSGQTYEVMLDDGRAYTREEWGAAAAADYERTDDGRWLFQGQPFAGRVERIAAVSGGETDLESAIQHENRIIRSQPLADERMDFATFVHFADRWAALGARQRAAALAIARGSIDTATDLIGPRYLSAEDALRGAQTPAWAEVTALVQDVEWVCLDADAVEDE